MLRTVIVILSFGCTLFTSAQKVVWAQKNNLDRKTDFSKVIGQNESGVYILKHKNSTFRKYFILEHFDKRMNLLNSKTIKIPNAELQKIVVKPKGIVFFVKKFNNDYTSSLLMYHLDSNFISDAPKVIFSAKNLINSTADFIIEYDNFKQNFTALYYSEDEKKTKLNYVYYENERLVKSYIYEIVQPFINLSFYKSTLTANGSLSTLYVSKKNSKNIKDEYRIMSINFISSVNSNYLINNEQNYISDFDLSYNEMDNIFNIIGFYGIKDEEENKGYFDIKMNAETFSIYHAIFKDIERKIIASIIGLKYEQKGENLNKFSIRKVIPRIDGGMLIIAERIYITTQSDVFYINGMPQTSYAKIFNNDEVLLINLDSSGNMVWHDVVVKNQSSINDGGYFNSIIVMVNDDNVNIIYNDRLSSNADIMQVTYTVNGEHIKKILFNSDQYYALVIPSEYNQVSANSIVIPINQNKDHTYIKLLY